ncbi:MAG TPA: hypothetical protein VII96_11340 [Acidimicrobiales bacterium]
MPTDSAATATARSEPTTGDVVRYRCAACGNLTRFNVVTTRRTSAFHHFSVGGDLTIEDEEVLDETVEEVTCRWCGNGKGVEVLEVLESDPA